MTSSTKIQLIVGLGNPGPQYESTRHNVGAWFVEMLAEQFTTKLQLESKFQARIGRIQIDSQDCWLLIPTTFMNHSGQSVQAFIQFYKIAPETILIVHDELDFPAGIIRFKQAGGHGGHNGLRDIIRHLHTNVFHRLRIGIGHPGDRSQVTDFVLTRPSRKEKEDILNALTQAQNVISDFVTGHTQKAIKWLHDKQEV